MKSKLKEMLKKKGISQRDLADKIGLTEAAVSRFVSEKRVPTGKNMLAIARVLNVDVEEIWEL